MMPSLETGQATGASFKDIPSVSDVTIISRYQWADFCAAILRELNEQGR